MRIVTLAALTTFSVAAFSLLGACQTMGGPGVSAYYECDRGLRLKVDAVRDVRFVSVNGGRAVALRPVTAAIEPTWEGGGHSLRLSGETATWNGPTREAPYSCRRVIVPR